MGAIQRALAPEEFRRFPERTPRSLWFFRIVCDVCGKMYHGRRLYYEGPGETNLMSVIGPQLLTQLLDEHSGALVLYAQQWCQTPEDVVQEALLRLMQQTSTPENVVGWLYRVVRNGAISASRSAARRSRREAAAAHCGEPWFTASEGGRLDAAAATAALKQLPIEQRETIVARLWGGLSYEQIAELTGSSTSSVHRWYQAGLAALRERLGVACPKKNSTLKT